MCLSTLYKNKISDENILMKNVASIESYKGHLVFTDLMERKLDLEASIDVANLLDGYIVVSLNK